MNFAMACLQCKPLQYLLHQDAQMRQCAVESDTVDHDSNLSMVCSQHYVAWA